MADQAPVETPQTIAPADVVSKESYEALKAQLEAKTKSEAAREQRLQVFEAAEREKLVRMQPAINEMIALEMKDNPEFSELKGVEAWGKDLHNTANVEANMGIARLVSCHSMRYKRTLDEASKGAEASTLLANTMKELEEVKADRDAKATRCDELKALSDERQGSLEKLEADRQYLLQRFAPPAPVPVAHHGGGGGGGQKRAMSHQGGSGQVKRSHH